jgi:hypothetical protein
VEISHNSESEVSALLQHQWFAAKPPSHPGTSRPS